VTRTDELPPFETRLLCELTDVVEGRRRADADARRQRPVATRWASTRWAVAATGVAAVAAALLIAPAVSRDTATGAFAVREAEDGVLVIRFEHDFRDGRALERELRSYGVDVAIRAVPASPSAVGQIYGTEGPVPGGTPGFDWGPDGSDTAFTIDPAVFRGQLTFTLAVEPAPGEAHGIKEEAFEPGEPLGGLHCALGEPVRAEQLVPHLDAAGLGVRWEVLTPDPGGDPGIARHETVDEVPAGEVMWAYAVDSSTVEVTVAPDGAAFDPDYYSPRLSDVPCTPDQVAAWD
jgi:hypothetical protein